MATVTESHTLNRAPRAFCWTPARIAAVATVFATPFVLLMIKLHAEAAQAVFAPEPRNVFIRFVVVGLFAALMTTWCIGWMKQRR